MKGNDGQVSVATWTDGGYSYAIDASGAALSADQAAALVQQIG
jgi:anti-sigma factor RsiW